MSFSFSYPVLYFFLSLVEIAPVSSLSPYDVVEPESDEESSPTDLLLLEGLDPHYLSPGISGNSFL